MTAPEDLVTSQHAEETSSRSDFDAESHDEDFDAEAENGRVKVTSSRERRSASCKKSSAASLIPNALYAEDGDGDDDSSEASDANQAKSTLSAAVSHASAAGSRHSDGSLASFSRSHGSRAASSILKKTSTATASRRSSKLSVRFGREAEDDAREQRQPIARGASAHADVVSALADVVQDYRESPPADGEASPRNSNVVSESQRAAQRRTESAKESIKTIDSTLQSLVVSKASTSATRRSSGGAPLSSNSGSALSAQARQMRKRRLGLTVGVVIAVLLLSVALVLLANMTANQKLLMTETEKLVESCETSQWSEWTACTPLCSAGYSTRRRIITVLGADPALCPSLVERRECVAECRAFAIARPTTERLTDQQIANFPACYGDLRKAIEEALDLGRDRSSITSMRTDLSTGSKFWQLEFVLYPDGNGAAETYDADPNRFAEDVVRKVFAALQGTPTTLARLISHCMPSDDVSNHVATYTAGTLEEIAAGRSTCSLFAGVSPFGCNCVVSEWSPWTVCDKQCSQRTAKRFRSIQHAEAFIDPQVDCPSLFEERPCAGSSKIFQVDLPTGVSLGTEAQRRAQFEYCSADLLASLAKVRLKEKKIAEEKRGDGAEAHQKSRPG
ncbi:hypothetical protein BESB_043910 [Besnoitia besnoiti]|uniref:Thrombospondin type 1 domain-containing protein n=1 Tax=Besnoitia besnoiti TaxID=94643 RepID=A0A2A9ME96_BESBE|nr:hypothetical protein BESB_043910 [Besnoitia besnoiti]PFH36199.1 hypothetical protein BESB_043910 [Besnoitia besnoiti]